MATHDVNLGVGNYAESGVTGMFYHAPAGTALPTYPGEALGNNWTEVGAIRRIGEQDLAGRKTEELGKPDRENASGR